MTYQHTNREQLESKIGKKNANRFEFRISEICKLAEELKIHVKLDYEPQDRQLKVVVKKDPEIQFDNQ